MIEELINYTKDQFQNNEMFSGAIIFSTIMGLMGSVLYYLRAIPEAIYGRIKRALIYQVSVEETDELYSYVEKWFASKYHKSYRNVEATLEETSRVDSPYDKTESGKVEIDLEDNKRVYYKHYEDSFMIFYRGCPVYVFKGREKMENASSIRQAFFNRYRFSGVLAKKAIMSMLEEIREYNVHLIDKDNINAYINDDYGTWEKMSEITPKPIESVILHDKELILADLNKYLKSRKWYVDRAIPYKRGYLFFGPPGNGKTTLCTSLAKELNRDVYFLSVADMKSDSNLKRAFTGLTRKSILVIEDIDSVFTGRKSKKDITFSAILGCLDGVLYPEDIITILTTNHPEKLDEALIREGRIDMHVEFPNPSKPEIEQYLSVFYAQEVTLGDCDPQFSMAKIQDICLRNVEQPENVIKLIEQG